MQIIGSWKAGNPRVYITLPTVGIRLDWPRGIKFKLLNEGGVNLQDHTSHEKRLTFHLCNFMDFKSFSVLIKIFFSLHEKYFTPFHKKMPKIRNREKLKLNFALGKLLIWVAIKQVNIMKKVH